MEIHIRKAYRNIFKYINLTYYIKNNVSNTFHALNFSWFKIVVTAVQLLTFKHVFKQIKHICDY